MATVDTTAWYLANETQRVQWTKASASWDALPWEDEKNNYIKDPVKRAIANAVEVIRVNAK